MTSTTDYTGGQILEHVFAPRGTLRMLWHRREPEVLVAGPAGTGKSRSCLEKLHMVMLLNPGARGLIVRKTLASLGSSALVTWRQQVIPEALEDGTVHFYGGGAQEPPQYRYANGSVVVLGGMDKASRIMSTEYDLVYIQEATELTVTDWESLLTRLRNWKVSFQQILADCNPDTPTHWLKERCDQGKTVMLESRHEDNPVLFDDDGYLTEKGDAYLAKLDNLTGVRKMRLREGKWVAAEGMIYEEYMPSVHLVDSFVIPNHWTRWWSIDFGYTNPFVCQMWAQDPDDNLYLYREIYQTKRTVDQHAEAILETVTLPDLRWQPRPDGRNSQAHEKRGQWTEPYPRAIVADWDAEGRAVLERELGRGVKPANKKVKEGIQACQARFRLRADGKPRIYFLRDSLVRVDADLADAKRPVNTVQEIPGYVWDLPPAHTEKAPKEEPVKEDDHGMDAMRYVVAELDLQPQPRVRVLP
jgi:PBSX family phage terminase large subunit